jgi:hypothetical protein
MEGVEQTKEKLTDKGETSISMLAMKNRTVKQVQCMCGGGTGLGGGWMREIKVREYGGCTSYTNMK